MTKTMDGKPKGFSDGIKVFSVAARACTVIGNSIFFHTTIITNNEFLVNLFKQDHGHDHSLYNKACTNGNNV
jgi:hypothetical protein